MNSLIQYIFEKKKSEIINDLWQDQQTQKIIGEQIGKAIMENKEIILNKHQFVYELYIYEAFKNMKSKR